MPKLKSYGTCPKCGLERKGWNVYRTKTASGVRYSCRTCKNKASREGQKRKYRNDPEWRQAQIERVRAYRAAKRLVGE